MRRGWSVGLILASVVVAALADIVVFPGHVIASLYFLPILLAALLVPPTLVWATVGLALLPLLAGTYLSHFSSEASAARLFMFATNAALALLIARNRQQSSRQAREQRALIAAARAILGDQSLAVLGKMIAEQAQAILGARIVQFWEMNPNDQTWHLIADRGLSPETSLRLQNTLSGREPLLTESARLKDFLEIYDLKSLPKEFEVANLLGSQEGLRSALIQPLRVNDQVLGSIVYLFDRVHEFTPSERGLISPIGSLWALAVERAHLSEEAGIRTQEADEARQHLQQFTAMIAHDLRPPLLTITGNLHQIARRLPVQSERERNSLQTCENAVGLMRRLVDDLLDTTQMSVGQFSISRSRVNLSDIASQVVEERQARAPEHTIVLNAPPVLDGFWDADRVYQLLTNLVTNAIKYSPSDTTVQVRLTRRNDVALIAVSDQGRGIPPEQMGRLFQAFSRLGPNPDLPGAGLGLFIARGIAEAHGGRIGVESREGGTTFWVTLPLVAESR